MEDTRTETASDVMNDLISELAVSQNILDVIFVEKHFFEDNHSSDAQVRGHLNRLNSIMQDVYATQDDYADAVEETPAPAPKKATKPVSDGVSASKKDKPKVTQEEIRALAADVKAKTGSVDKVKALLNAYSAKNISALPADKWDEFAAKLRELL